MINQTLAHSGGTDSRGGHYCRDENGNGYNYHYANQGVTCDGSGGGENDSDELLREQLTTFLLIMGGTIIVATSVVIIVRASNKGFKNFLYNSNESAFQFSLNPIFDIKTKTSGLGFKISW